LIGPLHRQTIEELRAALCRGEVSAQTVTRALLDRASALRPLNVFVELWPERALASAERLDGEGPRADRPLRGVPLAHKDMFARPGRQPGCGVASELAEAGLPPSPVLAALDRAGAIDLGPLNLAEFALGVTGTNAIFGDVANPWDLSRCTGASSSGSAAAVAAGLAFGSLGTDTGASVRVPASFCGVVGLMPTAGALDATGCFPLAWSLDAVGVLARTVADCALLFDVARGAEVGRSANPDSPLTIGLPDRYYTDGLDAEVASAWAGAARALESHGHTIVDVPVIEQEEMRSLHRTLMRTEAAAVHRRLLRQRPGDYSLAVRKFITGGEGIFGVDYVNAARARGVLLRRTLETTYAKVDVLLTPTVASLPAKYEEIADPSRSDVWRSVTRLAQFTQPASYLGLPAISVPFSLSSGGLPIGMQIIAPPGGERRLFSASLGLEAHWKGLDVWPRFAA
jgi:aspartyl-tRNA(Asn)/glutamyl-tRNA(Gln) amidotransferase subunit A